MNADCLTDREVLALLGGGLGAETATTAEAHLDSCRRCRLLLSTLAAKTGDEFRASPESAFSAGDTVAGRYRVIALIGSGGMGEVYRVVDGVLGETIALKTLAAGTTLDERGIARLKTEVQVARRVTHRNVCRVFDVGFHDEGTSIPFFTMELLSGETLRARLRRAGPLAPGAARDLLVQLASGLDAAHAAGVVHHDFKSENVMLVPDEGGTRVVIMDFGLARHHAEETLRQMPIYAREGRTLGKTNDFIAGTLGYMAPEQLRGAPTGPATDVYALGVVLYEVLTGELPFRAEELATAGVAGADKPPPALPPTRGLPVDWEAAIRRCLDSAPERRFSSAGDVAAAVAPFAVGDRPPASRRPGRRAALAVGVAGTIAVAIVGVAARLRGSRERASPTAAASPPTAMPSQPTAAASPPTAMPSQPTAAASAPTAAASGARRPRRRSSVGPPSGAGGALAVSARPPITDAPGKDDFVDPFGAP